MVKPVQFFLVFSFGGAPRHSLEFAIKIPPAESKTYLEVLNNRIAVLPDLRKYSNLETIKVDWSTVTITLVREVRDKVETTLYVHTIASDKDVFVTKNGHTATCSIKSGEAKIRLTWDESGALHNLSYKLNLSPSAFNYKQVHQDYSHLLGIVSTKLLEVDTIQPSKDKSLQSNQNLVEYTEGSIPGRPVAQPNARIYEEGDFAPELQHFSSTSTHDNIPRFGTPEPTLYPLLPHNHHQHHQHQPHQNQHHHHHHHHQDKLDKAYQVLLSIPHKNLIPLEKSTVTPEHIIAFAHFADGGPTSLDDEIARVFLFNKYFGAPGGLELIDEIQKHSLNPSPTTPAKFLTPAARFLFKSQGEKDEEIALHQTIFDLGLKLVEKYEAGDGAEDPKETYFDRLLLQYCLRARQTAALESFLLNSLGPTSNKQLTRPYESTGGIKCDTIPEEYKIERRDKRGRFIPGIYTVIPKHAYAAPTGKLSDWAREKYDKMKTKVTNAFNPHRADEDIFQQIKQSADWNTLTKHSPEFIEQVEKLDETSRKAFLNIVLHTDPHAHTASSSTGPNSYMKAAAIDFNPSAIVRKIKNGIWTPPDPYTSHMRPSETERDELENIVNDALRQSLGDSKKFDAWLKSHTDMDHLEKIKDQMYWLIRLMHVSPPRGVPSDVKIKQLEDYIKKTETYKTNLRNQKDKKQAYTIK